MEFTLYYHGELRSNGTAKHKHEIRKHFHEQLKVLWQQKPLNRFTHYLQAEPPEVMKADGQGGWTSLIRKRGPFEFAPLVSEQLKLVAGLDVYLLQPSEPGMIVTQSADIDNRLKTLFDALQMPDENQTPEDEVPGMEETPFYCVLENDRLITKVSIETGRLLEPVEKLSEVRLFIKVTVRPTEFTFTNADIGI